MVLESNLFFDNFSERHFSVPRAAKILKKVSRKSLDVDGVGYISGWDRDKEVKASGAIWDLWTKRILEDEMLDEWKNEKCIPKYGFVLTNTGTT